jgi:hypothetical protein
VGGAVAQAVKFGQAFTGLHTILRFVVRNRVKVRPGAPKPTPIDPFPLGQTFDSLKEDRHVMLALLQPCLRSSRGASDGVVVQANVVERDLTEMHVPPAFVPDVVRVVKAGRAALEAAAVTKRITFPTVDKLKVLRVWGVRAFDHWPAALLAIRSDM